MEPPQQKHNKGMTPLPSPPTPFRGQVGRSPNHPEMRFCLGDSTRRECRRGESSCWKHNDRCSRIFPVGICPRLTFHRTHLCFAMSFAKLFHSLDRCGHQIFQNFFIHIVQLLDIQTSHASLIFSKFFEQVFMYIKTMHQVQSQVLFARGEAS